MSDILSFVPLPTPVVINGKTYSVMPFTVREMAKLQKWVDSVAVNPYTQIKLNDLNSEARKEVLQAMRTWKSPSIGSEDANEYMNTLDGLQAMFGIILKKADPKATDADVENILGSYTLEGFTNLMSSLTELAFGKNEEVKGDPKEVKAE